MVQDESDALKQQLVMVTRENTRKLTELHHFANKDRRLEDSLNNRQKSMVTCPPPSRHYYNYFVFREQLHQVAVNCLSQKRRPD